VGKGLMKENISRRLRVEHQTNSGPKMKATSLHAKIMITIIKDA